MHRRIISVFLITLMILSLCACSRKNPVGLSEAFDVTPAAAATEVPQSIPPLSTVPVVPTTSATPTLIWAETEDGSLTASIIGDNGHEADINIGIVRSNTDVGDSPDSSDTTTTSPPAEVPAYTTPPQSSAGENTPPSEHIGPNLGTTYEQYNAMSGQEQTLFYYSFSNADDFIAWYNSALETYRNTHPGMVIGTDNVVNADEILGN